MRVWGSEGLGRVVATEGDQFLVPYGWCNNQSRRAVIWCHGAGGDYHIGPVELAIANALDCVWVNATCGGGAGTTRRWGDDASLGNVITDAWGAAKSRFNVKPDKCILWGGSMGGLTAILAALANPTKVAAVGVAIPAIDPEWVRQNDPGGGVNTTAINAFLGNPVPAGKQAYLRGADFAATGIPAKVWYSTSDTFTPLASTQQFLSDSGLPSVSLGAVGHSYNNITVQQVIDHLLPYVY